MLLRAPTRIVLRTAVTEENPTGYTILYPFGSQPSAIVCSAANGGASNSKPNAGVVFKPFEEVKKELNLIPTVLQQSLSRQKYTDESESAVNEQINEEERGHAEKFMEYQNKHGGKVKLQSILMPLSEFGHEEKGDALYAMELALSLEKLTNEKLLHVLSVACKNNDVQLADFVEREFLTEHVEAIKKISEYVAQLRRIGIGHGVWHFNQMLLNEGAAV